MFTEYPTYDRYRTLRKTDPVQRGEDVFALQTGLLACGFNPGDLDGILGSITAAKIKEAQQHFGLVVDGLAGGKTQEALGRGVSNRVASDQRVPRELMRGQLEHESGWRLGNYSPLRDDGSYDAGVAQRNTAHNDVHDSFVVDLSIEALGANTRKFYDKFAGVSSDKRRWGLAAGAWNAPAYASYIAKEEGATGVRTSDTAKPGQTARSLLEAYIASVTAYL